MALYVRAGHLQRGQEAVRPAEVFHHLIAAIEVAVVVHVGTDNGRQAVAPGELAGPPVGYWREVLSIGDLHNIDEVEDVVHTVAKAASQTSG